jgi:transcriptional regulator with XRE-family HTH domain
MRGKKDAPKTSSEDLKKLGERIRSLRINRGYQSHEIFAYEHNIPRAQYGRYERGEDLKYTNLLKIVRAFNMTLEEFFGEGFEEK